MTLPCPNMALPVCGVDAVCPADKGAVGSAYSTLFALRAKALLSGAPDHGFIAGESCLRGGLPLNDGRAARPGDGSMPSCAPRDHQVHATIPQGARRALPAPAQGSSLGYHSKCNRKERIGHRKALC